MPGQQPALGTGRPSQLPAQRPGQQPGLNRPSQLPAQQPGQGQRVTAPGQQPGVQYRTTDGQRQQNFDQALNQRDDNLDDVLDHRQDLAGDVMDHREDLWDDINSPNWQWAVGAAVLTPPAVYQPVVYENTTYYYCDGHYLEPVYAGDDVSYMVTYPATGTEYCGDLPAETQIVDVNGYTYYVYADVYYSPNPDDGPDCYVVVDAP